MSDVDTADLITRLNAKAIVEAYRAGKEAGMAENARVHELLGYAVEWVRDRGYDDPETAPEWFLTALTGGQG